MSGVQFLKIYGLDLRVVTSGDVDYVDPRPVCAMAGINWGVFQASIMVGDLRILYGTTVLSSPNIAFDERPKDSNKPSPFIRLDRLKLLLARIDTEKMRWQKNVVQADALLEDQERWASDLNRAAPYEVTGVGS